MGQGCPFYGGGGGGQRDASGQDLEETSTFLRHRFTCRFGGSGVPDLRL